MQAHCVINGALGANKKGTTVMVTVVPFNNAY